MAQGENWVGKSSFLEASAAQYYKLENWIYTYVLRPTETLPFEWLHLIKWCIKTGTAEMPGFPLALPYFPQSTWVCTSLVSLYFSLSIITHCEAAKIIYFCWLSITATWNLWIFQCIREINLFWEALEKWKSWSGTQEKSFKNSGMILSRIRKHCSGQKGHQISSHLH